MSFCVSFCESFYLPDKNSYPFEWPKDIKRLNAKYVHMKLQSMFDITPDICMLELLKFSAQTRKLS